MPARHSAEMSRIPLPPPLDRQPFTPAHAAAHGIGRGRYDGADLSRPFHGVRYPAAQVLDLEARCRSFLLRMPAHAFFNAATAARILGAPLPAQLERSTVLDVAVPNPSRASSARGVHGHKVQLMGGDTQVVRGLPISSAPRLWCELAAVLTVPDLVAVGDYLIHWRLPFCSRDDLVGAVARFPGRHGRAKLREALPLLNDRSESRPESLLRVMLGRAGFHGLVANLPIDVRGMRFCADLALPSHKLVLEYQGKHHNDPAQWRKDMTKREVLASDGWHTMYINSDDLEGDELAKRIRVVLASSPLWASGAAIAGSR